MTICRELSRRAENTVGPRGGALGLRHHDDALSDHMEL
jgi:hypothetical protein